jgi:hypothetical protein
MVSGQPQEQKMSSNPKRESDHCAIRYFADTLDERVPGRSRFCVEFKRSGDAAIARSRFAEVARRIFRTRYLGVDSSFAPYGWIALYLERKTPIALKQKFIDEISLNLEKGNR